MNTYNETLQETVINTLSALSVQQTELESTRIAAEYTLYYAQGAELTARDNLADTRGVVVHSQHINNQSLFNSNQAYNLLTSLTQANTDVAASVTNAATAAANVQIASNAIATLAADIGAALNVSTASLFGDDSYRKIQDANSFVNEVANNSKAIALHAMNGSARTSEIIAAAVLSQGNTVKTKVNAMYAATSAALTKYSDLAISQNQTVSQTSKTGRQAQGAMRNANREAAAITAAYVNANANLNLRLHVHVVSSQNITVSFIGLPSPLPTFTAPPASAIVIPAAHPQYYLALVREDAQSMFSVDQAEQLFMQWNRMSAQFCKVIPGDKEHNNSITLSVDVYGVEIAAGVGYVAFLFIGLAKDYQRFVNNYSDLLSAPSQSFIPATTLPRAEAWSPANPPVCPVVKLAEPSLLPPLYFKASLIVSGLNDSAKQASANATEAANHRDCGSAVAVATKAAAVATIAAAAAANQAAACMTREQAHPFLEAGSKAVLAATTAAIAAKTAAFVGTAGAETALGDAANTAAAAAAGIAAASARDILSVANDGFNLEFRCILVEEGAIPDLAFMTCMENDRKKPIYFNLSIACQVAPSNYVVATQVDEAATKTQSARQSNEPAILAGANADGGAVEDGALAGAVVASDFSDAHNNYMVCFSATTTDNFGNLIRKNATYSPYILAIVNDDHTSRYTPVLTNHLALLASEKSSIPIKG